MKLKAMRTNIKITETAPWLRAVAMSQNSTSKMAMRMRAGMTRDESVVLEPLSNPHSTGAGWSAEIDWTVQSRNLTNVKRTK